MNDMSPSRWDVAEVSPNIGCTIKTDKQTLLSGAKAKEIRALMESRGVIVFPQINLTDEEQIAFTHTLGTFAHEVGESKSGMDTVYPITMDPKVNPNASYLRGAFFWHIDGTMSDMPILGSIMSARSLATQGGETDFCNTYAAYADLPEEEKAKLEGLRVRHALEATQRLVTPQPTVAELLQWRSRPSRTHPLVWHHKSGHSSLLIGATGYYVEGMSREDSDMLLCRIQEWATQDEYVYRHKWTVGDFLLFDNTGGMHRADWYSLDSDRLMHRCTLDGEEPITN